MIEFEKTICEYLHLPSIPKKTWDGKASFDKGVAVVGMHNEREAYAVAKYDAEKDTKPRIVKVFSQEPFREVKTIFVVPNYMANEEDVKTMDLDEGSKKKAEEILKEATEIENEGTEEKVEESTNEYYFDNITNDDEAKAFIKSYNERNRIKRGRIPSTHEGLVMRLAVIWSEINKKTNGNG